jgi:hypothetical protein
MENTNEIKNVENTNEIKRNIKFYLSGYQDRFSSTVDLVSLYYFVRNITKLDSTDSYILIKEFIKRKLNDQTFKNMIGDVNSWRLNESYNHGLIFISKFILQNNPMTNKKTAEYLSTWIPECPDELGKLMGDLSLLQMDYLFAETIKYMCYLEEDKDYDRNTDKQVDLSLLLEDNGASLNYDDNSKCEVFQKLIEYPIYTVNILRHLICGGATLSEDMISKILPYKNKKKDKLRLIEIRRLKHYYEKYNKFNILRKKIFDNINYNCDLYFDFKSDFEF